MKTNLDEIRDICKCLLNLPIEENEEFLFILTHPYFEFIEVPIGDSGSFGMINVTTPGGFQKAVDFWEERIDKMDLISLFMSIRKQYRLLLFKLSKDFLSEKDFADMLAHVWVESENPNMDINVSINESAEFFKEANKEILMEPEDYNYYLSLPDEFTIYRGVSKGRTEKGLSWTRNKEKAEWFASRFGSGYVLQATAKKRNVLAYFNTRDEDEIVIHPRNLKYKKL